MPPGYGPGGFSWHKKLCECSGGDEKELRSNSWSEHRRMFAFAENYTGKIVLLLL